MSDTFNTTPANWQGVDDEPTAGSDNMVKSSGVFEKTKLIDGYNNYVEGGYITSDGTTITESSDYAYSEYIDVSSEVGNNIAFYHGVASLGYICLYDSSKTLILSFANGSYPSRSVEIPTGCVYARYSFLKTFDARLVRVGETNPIWSKEFVKGLKDNKLDVSKSQSLSSSQKQTALENLGLPTGVDAKPTENSTKLVESGGVFNSIKDVDFKTDLSGRKTLKSSLVARQAAQVVFNSSGLYGKFIAMRILYNKATFAQGTTINVTFYNNGSAFLSDTISNDWLCKDIRHMKYVDRIYATTSGEVTVAGDICIEIAYNAYYPIVNYASAIQQGTISLPNVNSNISKMFENRICFDDVTDLRLEIKNLITGLEHPFVHVYGIYSQDGNVKKPLQPIVADNEIITIASYGYKYLWGIYYWNEQNDSKTFDATIYVNMVDGAISNIKPYDYSSGVPTYYEDYLNNRITLLRGAVKNTIINGDVFYFITDTHWEYNTKHSPALIKTLNRTLSIPRLLHGGDMYHFGLNNDKYDVECINLYRDAINSDKVYETDGNHEYMFGLAKYGDLFAETRIFLDNVVYGGDNKNYYYVDNNEKKIRYISLCAYGEGASNMLVDADQQNWLANTALNVEEGWCIIIFTHVLCETNIQNNYAIIDRPGASDIYGIINNYQGNGKIIGILEGHVHIDFIEQSKCVCPIIASTRDSNHPFRVVVGGQDYYDDSYLIEPRDTGTIAEQAFDVCVFDKDNLLIHCIRIGSRALNKSGNYNGNAQVDVRTVYINAVNSGSTFTIHPFYQSTTWDTSDASVVSVSDGECTANSSGYAVITSTTQDGFKQSFFIKVT